MFSKFSTGIVRRLRLQYIVYTSTVKGSDATVQFRTEVQFKVQKMLESYFFLRFGRTKLPELLPNMGTVLIHQENM